MREAGRHQADHVELPVRAQQGLCLYFKGYGSLKQQPALIIFIFVKGLSGCCPYETLRVIRP